MSMKITVDKSVWNNLKKSFAKAEKVESLEVIGAIPR